jgi:hypothetical protein
MFRLWENKFKVPSTSRGNENHYHDNDSDSDSDFNYLENTDGENKN